MEKLISTTIAYFWLPETQYVILGFVVLTILLLRLLESQRGSIRNTALLFAICLVGQFTAAVFEAFEYSRLAVMVHEVFVIGSGFALLRLMSLFVFRIVLPMIRLEVVSIAEDITFFVACAVLVIGRLNLIGLDPSSLLTTSAVITGVLAFSMQDTLGNVLSGVALHLDNSLQTGDWIHLEDLSGRVLQIRWRQTSVMTRNGEMVVIPNSQLMKGRFTVFARADRPEWSSRRWVWFNVTYDSAPAEVIRKVEKSIRTADIPNVADDPQPTCVLMDFGPGYARYALRYWMIDPQPDDPTDSAVRIHLFAALQRSGMKLATPEQSVHVTKEGDAYHDTIRSRDTKQRIADLHKVELFSRLHDDELAKVSESLVYAPFARGAVIFQQGEKAHWLYLLVKGEAEVLLEFPGHPRQHLRTIRAGKTFGVRGVLTGELRRDTVVAKTDVVCYRLDQAIAKEIFRARPEMADEVARILEHRESELDHVTRKFMHSSDSAPVVPTIGLLDKIKDFLRL